MKLREVIRAISGFKYEVNEYDCFPQVKAKSRVLKLSIDETNIRCLNHGMHHEQLVGGAWYIIEESQFKSILSGCEKTIVRKAQTKVQTPVDPTVRSSYSRLSKTKHMMERLEERFGVSEINSPSFLKTALATHRVVQNAQFFNDRAPAEVHPSNLHLCDIETNSILCGRLDKGCFVVTTVYTLRDSPWFVNWFEMNQDTWDNLPQLHDFFV